MAIEPSDLTSHGLTSNAANVVSGSIGARIVPLLGCSLVTLFCTLDFIREGAEVMCIRGSSAPVGEVFLRFRDPWLSSESDSELESDPEIHLSSESSAERSDTSAEADAGSDTRVIVADLAWALEAAILYATGRILF